VLRINPRKIKLPLETIVIIAITGALTTIAFYAYHFHGPISKNPESWALLGDFFGGVLNPIFGFLTIIALLVTIKIQIEELKLTRTEITKSAAALSAQQKTLEQQSIEQSFFRFLENLEQDEFVLSFRNTSLNLCNEIFNLIYEEGETRADRDIRQEYAIEKLKDKIDVGAINQVLIEKVSVLIIILNKMKKPQRALHLRLLQTHLESPLISFIYHYTSMTSKVRFELIKSSGLISVVAPFLIFTRKIASEKNKVTPFDYESRRSELAEKFRKRYLEEVTDNEPEV
tara:strand:+ start:172 stop:1029 length:858 start_codon:yes stop_codon:yes gene_type:complete